MMKTKQQIDTEIAALKALVPRAMKTRLMIVASIDELSGDIDRTAEEWNEMSHSEQECANDAMRWKQGESVPAPSTTFKGLVE